MKTINVPFISGLEKMSYGELDLAMETGAAKSIINEVNWKSDYPYQPDAVFSIARSERHLAIMYHVRGLDLRARALEYNGNVWEDSCCEFFVSDPCDGTYYNFEMNCIGTLLASKRRSREDADMFTAEQLDRVVRHSTLERKERELNGKIFGWSVALCIPFDLFGVDPDNLPENLRGNFFKCGDKTAHPHFLSWNPIVCPAPDFHRPDFFGTLVLG